MLVEFCKLVHTSDWDIEFHPLIAEGVHSFTMPICNSHTVLSRAAVVVRGHETRVRGGCQPSLDR